MSANPPSGVDPAAWAALLKWSIAQTGEGDGTAPTDLAPMSQEKKDFLEAVMKDGVVIECGCTSPLSAPPAI